MRTANPALNASSFRELEKASYQDIMTINGTVDKTSLLLLLVIAAAYFTWNMFTATNTFESVAVIMTIAGIVGFIVAIVTVFKKTLAPITAPVYAVAEGLLLGGLSAYAESLFPGIVFQAVFLTFGTLGGLLLAYRSGIIKATENFKLGVFAATGGIAFIYIISFVLGLFGMSIPLIHESGLIGIGFSAFVVVIAALNLVLDFDFIEHAAEQGLPKYIEWYAAFGLLVTLVWLYIEILRLLMKLRSRD